jgi:hypothetical protein
LRKENAALLGANTAVATWKVLLFWPLLFFPGAPTEDTGDLDETLPPKQTILWRF